MAAMGKVGKLGHQPHMEIVVDYDPDVGPPLVRYPSSDGPDEWRYVASREEIHGIPAEIPYGKVIESIFYNAVNMYGYEHGDGIKNPESDFDHTRDYKAAVAFAERTPIQQFQRRDFFLEIYRNRRGVSWWATTINVAEYRDGRYSVILSHNVEARLSDGHSIRAKMKNIDEARQLGIDLIWRMSLPDGPRLLWRFWKKQPAFRLAFGFSALNAGGLPHALRKILA
jgi:hypothetical protein